MKVIVLLIGSLMMFVCTPDSHGKQPLSDENNPSLK
ncbi:hypothetical protein DFR28_1104 [Arenicella xantha]|uniref:Uncharacterized protein n=1 Tax=Arenicella xantha TaxID=644221 RepID=A0A395JK11_9GAMM|nr:hypothetical protein DFR28_1104 [Arenicella xantha]